MTAALALVAAIGAGLLANGFAIGDARLARLQVNRVFTLDALDDNLQVGFTDAGEQHFGGFRVARNAQRAIFFYNTSQCITHFIQVGLTFWENGDGVARLWEVNGFQGSAASLLLESVSPVWVLASFATAPKSPAGISVALSCILPRGVMSCPMRSSAFVCRLYTCISGLSVPV